MAYQRSAAVTATTNGSGAATVYTEAIRGKIIAVAYAKTDFADGVDFTITTETTGQNVWVDTNVNASETVFPKMLNDDTAGSDLTAIYDHVRVFNERVKIVIAQGGDTKTGTFTVYYE